MSKIGILQPGNSFTFQITAKNLSGDIVDWDDVTDFEFKIYSKNYKILKTFDKSDLVIDDPSTGIAIAEITGEYTESPELDQLYIAEYKYKVDSKEISAKSEWGTFKRNATAKQHFV